MFGFCAKICAPHGDPVTKIQNENQNQPIKTDKIKISRKITP